MSHGRFRTHNIQDSESRPPAGGMTAGHRRSAKGSRPVAHLAGHVLPGMLVFGTNERPVKAWRWSICGRPPSGRRGRGAVGTRQQQPCHQLDQEGGRQGRPPHFSSEPRPGSVPSALSGSGPDTWLGHKTSPPVAKTRGDLLLARAAEPLELDADLGIGIGRELDVQPVHPARGTALSGLP
jgi:hypothetical protein